MIKDESLGIPNYGPWYYRLSDGQNITEEIIYIHNFIDNVVSMNQFAEFKGKEMDIQFINYGKTQLVFVLTIDNSRQYTLLVNQPATEYGIGKREFDNLELLSNKFDEVIKPLYYFGNGKSELYVTPYMYKSRCIGVETSNWGVWIPEPQYHFRSFDLSDRKVINTCMVALMIKFYNSELEMGISKCRLDGGDFMLEKDFEKNPINVESILKKIKLIAARDLISMNLDDYIARLRLELSSKNVDDNLIIGKTLRCPLSEDEIEDGIKLGLELRKKSKVKNII